MTYGKWNTSGELTWATGGTVIASDMNTSFGKAIPPIGSVMFWCKSFTGVPGTLPTGWVECNGATISDSDSPLNGQTLPTLNTGNRFLRGNSTSGGTGGAETHSHTLYKISNGATGAAGHYSAESLSGDAKSSLPAYYNGVWIIRIK